MKLYRTLNLNISLYLDAIFLAATVFHSDDLFSLKFCYKLQVDINNLEEYISLVVDATVKTGIMRQMEAFRAGFNQVQFHLSFMSSVTILRNCCALVV